MGQPRQDDSRYTRIETQIEYLEKDIRKSLDNIFSELKNLNNKIDSVDNKLNKKIDDLDSKVNSKIDANFKWLIGTFISLFVVGTAGTIVTILLKM